MGCLEIQHNDADDFHKIGDHQTVTVRTALSFTGHEKKLCILNT